MPDRSGVDRVGGAVPGDIGTIGCTLVQSPL
jgi:hypothetical protein